MTMIKETPTYSIKLPSSAYYVTIKNINKTCEVIANTGKTFTEDDLLERGAPVNKHNIFRILSYLRYLGILKERREKIIINGETKKIQKWYQNDKKDIEDYFYYLQDNRHNEAKKIFAKLITNHDLFKSIKEEIFKTRTVATDFEFKDFFRNKNPGKRPDYYNSGYNFVISLLEDCDLVYKEGNKIKLKNTIKEEIDTIETDKITNPTHNNTNIEKTSQILGTNKYSVSIIGENTNFTFSINDVSDIDDVETILTILRKKVI